MPKKKRSTWQQLGFCTYAEYKQHAEKTKVKTKIANIFQDCLQEAVNCHAAKQRQNQESTDRLKYHNLRLQELAHGNHHLQFRLL